MKTLRLISVLIPLLAAGGSMQATSCAPGTLTDYISLGSTGCSVGTTLFSDFLTLSIPNGAIQIDPSIVQVTPISALSNPGFLFTFNLDASAGEFFDLNFGFQVTDNALTSGSASMTGTSATGDGVVTTLEEFCAGGVFSPYPFCSGSYDNLLLFDTEFGSLTSDSRTFAAVTTLGVAKDIGIDGGLAGTAALASLTDQFHVGAIPEPSSIYLLASALSAFAFTLVRRRKR